MGFFDSFLKIVSNNKRVKPDGAGITPTHSLTSPNNVLTAPLYREHLTDIFDSRQADSSLTLLQQLFRQDPDVSAAVHGYLTLANTDPIIYAKTLDGEIDKEATKDLHKAILLLTRQVDYTQKFQFKHSLDQLCQDLRYMALLRGAVACELVMNKQQGPENIKIIDASTLVWYETKPNLYKPKQKPAGSNEEIDLDIPTFFVSFYRRDPTTIYAYSPFVSVINTVAARQQVINDLYRIMQLTGYPRLDVKVVEEVIRNRAPANIRNDAKKMTDFVDEQMRLIANQFSAIRIDQASVHSDSVELSIINDKNPGAATDISSVIETLNAQNQAALKTMSTMLGRGGSGVNTSSVEARVAAMFADELNEPIADLLQKMLSFLLHQQGFQGFAYVEFPKAELRPDLELEPQKLIRSQRLRQDLSDGIITDIEYCLQMYNRLPIDGAPELSGTGFLTPAAGGDLGPQDVNSNGGPLQKSLAPEGKTKVANANKTGQAKK